MQQTTLIQGSPEWHAHRAQFFNASDAPAMMSCSPHMTRSELLHRLHTGISPEIDAATQRRFDDGHRFEALARPLAEQIIGEDLFAVTGTNGKLSASFDGVTMLECTIFEHKTLNDSLRYTPWDEGNGDHLPLHYRVQMEHQLMVADQAKCALFMATRWDGDTMAEGRHCWYASDPALRKQIQAGWDQFAADLAAYTPAPTATPAPTGHAPDALPALRIEVTGMVTASNLAEFKATALAAIRGVNRELATDQHFADAERAVKWCSEVEDRLQAAKAHALSQTASIDELFRAIDDIAAEARRTRLDLDKLVKARKEDIKGEIVASGNAALREHVIKLAQRVGMPSHSLAVVADFSAAVKGKRSIDSLRDAVATELARAKIAANEMADRIDANIKTINAAGADHLFHDRAALVLKQTDDLAAAIAQRLAAEQQRIDQERERIRAQEVARLEREREAQDLASRREQARADAILTIPSVASHPAPAAVTEDDGERFTLGRINSLIGPLSISAAGLSELGFEPAEKVKAALQYRASDFPAICRAIAAHVANAAQGVSA